MARWKLRGRSKSGNETADQKDTDTTKTETPQQTQTTSLQEQCEETPVMEYNETLYAQAGPVRKPSYASESRQEMKYRASWENPSTIEENVDRIEKRKVDSLSSHPDVDNQIERKVDRLISKKKVQR